MIVSDDKLKECKPEAKKIQEGIEQMTKSLHQVKNKAEEIFETDEQAFKRARLEEPADAGDGGSPMSSTHFAMAGK